MVLHFISLFFLYSALLLSILLPLFPYSSSILLLCSFTLYSSSTLYPSSTLLFLYSLSFLYSYLLQFKYIQVGRGLKKEAGGGVSVQTHTRERQVQLITPI